MFGIIPECRSAFLRKERSASPESPLRDRLKKGFIGFPDLGHRYSLRNLTIEDLREKQKWVELFDGNTLDGWKLRNGGNWSIRDGAIYGANGDGILYAPGRFQNFELTMLVRSHNRVNSGVFLRGSPDLKEYRGFEVQIFSPVDAVFPTGSILYEVARQYQ